MEKLTQTMTIDMSIRRPTAKQWRGVVYYALSCFLFSSPARSFDSGAAPHDSANISDSKCCGSLPASQLICLSHRPVTWSRFNPFHFTRVTYWPTSTQPSLVCVKSLILFEKKPPVKCEPHPFFPCLFPRGKHGDQTTPCKEGEFLHFIAGYRPPSGWCFRRDPSSETGWCCRAAASVSRKTASPAAFSLVFPWLKGGRLVAWWGARLDHLLHIGEYSRVRFDGKAFE